MQKLVGKRMALVVTALNFFGNEMFEQAANTEDRARDFKVTKPPAPPPGGRLDLENAFDVDLARKLRRHNMKLVACWVGIVPTHFFKMRHAAKCSEQRTRRFYGGKDARPTPTAFPIILELIVLEPQQLVVHRFVELAEVDRFPETLGSAVNLMAAGERLHSGRV